MNDNDILLRTWAEADCDSIDFDDLENKLESDLEEDMASLEGLKDDMKKIGTPDSIGETVLNVVWEQFINQVGVVAGEDFIKENRGLTLDLRNSAHIQTAENFKNGKLASHNHYSREEIQQNHDRYKNTPHSEFRKEYVDPGMDSTLPRAGHLYSQGVETVTDLYTGRQISTKTKLEDGSNNPKSAQREHVIASSTIYDDPSLQMANSSKELASIINDRKNLQGYTTAERNNRKSNHTPEIMDERDKTKHWEDAHKKANDYLDDKRREGENRLKSEGRKTQKEEAFRIGGKALRTVIMNLLASLIKEIIRKLVSWLRAGAHKLSTFIDSIKEAIKSFVANIKEHMINAGDTLITTIATAIFGPIIGMIKKAWIFLKQGYKSLKQAILFLKDPAKKNMPFSIKMMEVGKFIIAGLTAGGAIVLSTVIENGLTTIPVFAFEIPLIGSLANLIGMFLGALTSGLIGAMALNLIDRAISKKLKETNALQQFEKKSEIIRKQEHIIDVKCKKTQEEINSVVSSISQRHKENAATALESIRNIADNHKEINSILNNKTELPLSENSKILDDLLNALNSI